MRAADDELAVAARNGRLHRNFQGYTTDTSDALIGLGASAIGRLPQGYVQNAPDIAGYSRAIESGEFATVKGIALSAEDRLRAHVIERLMCDLCVDLDAAAHEVGVGPPGDFADELESLLPFVRDGLVAVDGRRIEVTEHGAAVPARPRFGLRRLSAGKAGTPFAGGVDRGSSRAARRGRQAV